MTQLSRYLYAPYRALRMPLAVIDSRLREQSPVRAVTATALGLTDQLAARLFDEERPAAGPRPAAHPEPVPAHDTVANDDAAGQQARQADLDADRTRKEHTASRSNKSVATIRRDLARTEAIADARQHRTEETEQQ